MNAEIAKQITDLVATTISKVLADTQKVQEPAVKTEPVPVPVAPLAEHEIKRPALKFIPAPEATPIQIGMLIVPVEALTDILVCVLTTNPKILKQLETTEHTLPIFQKAVLDFIKSPTREKSAAKAVMDVLPDAMQTQEIWETYFTTIVNGRGSEFTTVPARFRNRKYYESWADRIELDMNDIKTIPEPFLDYKMWTSICRINIRMLKNVPEKTIDELMVLKSIPYAAGMRCMLLRWIPEHLHTDDVEYLVLTRCPCNVGKLIRKDARDYIIARGDPDYEDYCAKGDAEAAEDTS